MDAKKILVADDEAHIRHIVSMKLQNAGYDVTIAADGEEAYDLICQDRPDLMITDYQMPLMSGMELCLKLRQSEHAGAFPIIMLTARGFDLEDGESEQAGIHAMMSKPFSPREVLQKVQELLGVPAGQV